MQRLRKLISLWDKEAARVWFRQRKLQLIFYACAIVFVVFVYHLFSDGNFSFLLTLAAITRMFAFAILTWRIWSLESAAGLSLKTLELYALVFTLRLSSILTYEGYLPFDRSGDWLFQVIECLSFVWTITCIYFVTKRFRSTYDAAADSFGHLGPLPSALGALVVAVPAMIIAAVVHPSLNSFWLTDWTWTAACYAETLAFLPQLLMFQRKGGEIESWSTHFVFLLGVARAFEFWFWISSYHELNHRLASLNGFLSP